MQIAVHQDSSLIMHVPDELFRVVNRRMEEHVWRDPSPVEVDSKK